MKLVTRDDWGARPPRSVSRRTMREQTTAHWNGPTITISGKRTWDHSRCAQLVRGIQNFHMDGRKWNDIAYNFVECPHGYTFEGRGLNSVNGANGTNEANRSSHAICSLAGEENPFPENEKVGFRECVMFIANQTGAPEGCKGHRDHKATACPGDARYSWVHAGMPVKEPTPIPSNPIVSIEEDDIMNEPVEIVREPAGHWHATDGVTRQWIRNKAHAAILVFNRGAKVRTPPKDMSKEGLDVMQPFDWPQAAFDSIRPIGPVPPPPK